MLYTWPYVEHGLPVQYTMYMNFYIGALCYPYNYILKQTASKVYWLFHHRAGQKTVGSNYSWGQGFEANLLLLSAIMHVGAEKDTK